jgi:hypothetical protein
MELKELHIKVKLGVRAWAGVPLLGHGLSRGPEGDAMGAIPKVWVGDVKPMRTLKAARGWVGGAQRQQIHKKEPKFLLLTSVAILSWAEMPWLTPLVRLSVIP